MRPDPSRVLGGVAMAMLVNLPPEVRTPFGQSLTQMGGMLNLILAVEMDRIVNRLDAENRVVAAILADASPLVAPELADRLRAAAGVEAPPNLRLSTLQGINDRLRELLLEVHVAVEAAVAQEAVAMNARIWDELRESTRRRHVEVPR